MRVIYNRFIPFRGFKAINLFGVVFARHEFRPISDRTKRHEHIHTRQLIETLFIPFYLWYGIESLVRLIQFRNRMAAYRNISFEREAFANEENKNYLSERRMFSFLKYVINGKSDQ